MRIKNISTKKIIFSDLYVPNTLENISLLPNDEVVVFDEDAEKSVGLKTMFNAGSVEKISNEEPNEGSDASDDESSIIYSGTGSFQTTASDLVLEAAAGSNTSSSPKFLGGVMGNLLDNGAALTKASNYLGGVIGHYTVTGTKATTYPSGAILAGIGDGVTQVDGAVVAYIDGDSAQTNAGAAFTVRNNNSTPGSGFSYGLDLKGAAHDGYPEVSYLTGEIRFSNGTKVTVSGDTIVFTNAANTKSLTLTMI